MVKNEKNKGEKQLLQENVNKLTLLLILYYIK